MNEFSDGSSHYLNCFQKLSNVQGKIGEKVFQKFKSVLEKNVGFNTSLFLSKILGVHRTICKCGYCGDRI
mgnify:CR=1 FL=1